MDLRIFPSTLSGEITVPPSKSAFQRAVAIAALCKTPTTIYNPSYSDDGVASLRIAAALGAEIDTEEDFVTITPRQHEISSEWNIGESGLSARLFIPVAATFDAPLRVVGEGSILNRPIGVYEELFQKKGIEVKSNNGFLPFEVTGPLKPGVYEFDGSLSSQHVTGLLIACTRLGAESKIIIQNMTSYEYIDLTIDMLNSFGAGITKEEENVFIIPGDRDLERESISTDADWSSAATLMCAGAICGRGHFEVKGLDTEFTQADKAVTGALLFAGSKLKNQLGDYQITTHQLRAFEFDATDCPDLFPVLSALAVFCKGTSKIKGVHRLKHKESDRGEVIVLELRKCGIECEILDDAVVIVGGSPTFAELDSHGDHRIAMMCGLVGMGGDGCLLKGGECVSKSYPDFYNDIADLGANVKAINK